VAIRIDVHPTGKTRPTRHIHPTLSPRMVSDHTYLTWSMPSNILRSHQQSWAGLLFSRKRTPDIIHSTPVDRSVDPYPVSLLSQPMKQWGQSQPSVDGWLLGLPGLYHWYAIGTFNACSRGPTYRSLTDTGRGYKLGGAGLPHTNPWPSQLTVSTFHRRAPPSLQLNHIPPIKAKVKI
jgi:hypothetical protein